MVASPKTVAKANEDKRFYHLEIVFDPKMGMQIKQNSNQVGPFDIIGALDIVKGLHEKYFIDSFSQQAQAKNMDPETKAKFDEALQKTFKEMGLDEKGNKIE